MKNEAINKIILVVLAHPDDESYGMGGTLAKFSHLGAQIILLCATRGEAGISGIDPEKAGRIREQELKKAAENLKIRVFLLDYSDGTLPQLNSDELTERISVWIDAVDPGIIITFGPDGISGHPDHIAVSNAVTGAVNKYFQNISLLYLHASEATKFGCGVTQSTEQSSNLLSVDISDFKMEKVKAIQSHKSQNTELTGDLHSEMEKIACSEYFSIAHIGQERRSSLKWVQEKAG